MKKIKYLVPLLFLMAFTGIAAVVAPTYPMVRLGSYWTSVQAFDSTNIGVSGGQVLTYLAGDSEFVGSVAYISAKNTVKMDTILTHYNNVAGVVIGGSRTSFQGLPDSASVGTLAAIAGQRVFVLIQGRTWVTLDTVGTGISPGSMMIPSNKQGMRGRVAAKTTAIDSFYRALGKIVDTGVVNTKRLINVSIK